jgi:S-adenosylmethionine synthetase
MCANDSESCKVQLFLSSQSEDISQGVTEGEGMFESQGAGDQGLMFGYATDESESWDELKGFYMPLPILLSQRLTMALSAAGLNGTLEWARPDAKSQVTVEYSEEGKPIRCETIVVAIQHDDLLGMFDGDESKEQQYFQSQVVEHIINKVIPSQLMDEQTNVIVNGTGRFEKGGPHADAGLTGRKIIVDTYGGMGRHGGGAFSGKDPSKVDRSAAYASRWAAKHIIAAGLAQRCEIQLAYAIGVAEPISIKVETFGTGNISDSEISERLSKAFDFRPAVIISELGLLKPIFKRTAAGGHFGRVPEDDGGFSWEALDQTKIAILQNQ